MCFQSKNLVRLWNDIDKEFSVLALITLRVPKITPTFQGETRETINHCNIPEFNLKSKPENT